MFDSIILGKYFNAEDTAGVIHLGFLQAMTFPEELSLINDISAFILDTYIFNRFSRACALDQWRQYMTWDKEERIYKINSTFYADFAAAAYVEMLQADKINTDILAYNFKDFSYSEVERITHGSKITERDYDNVVITVTAGLDTKTNGQRVDIVGRGEQQTVRGQDTTTDAEMVYDSTTFQDRDKSTSTYGNVTVTDAERQTTTGAQTNTVKLGDRETATGARQDVESINSYIDTNERTKHILIAPDKYFEIQKQLASINAYSLLGDAVLRAFHNGTWG